MQRHLANLSNKVNENNILVYYKGPFDDIILDEIGKKIRDGEYKSPKIGKRLFSIFIELAQNISLYSEEKNQIYNSKSWGIGSVAIQEGKEGYSLVCGNLVKKSVLDEIIEKCNKINMLDHEGLRAMKREYRSSEAKKNHTGGNIGLIQIALKSDLPLTISAESVDELHSFFTISVNVFK